MWLSQLGLCQNHKKEEAEQKGRRWRINRTRFVDPLCCWSIWKTPHPSTSRPYQDTEADTGPSQRQNTHKAEAEQRSICSRMFKQLNQVQLTCFQHLDLPWPGWAPQTSAISLYLLSLSLWFYLKWNTVVWKSVAHTFPQQMLFKPGPEEHGDVQ